MGGNHREAWRQDLKIMAPISSRRRKISLIDSTSEVPWGSNMPTRSFFLAHIKLLALSQSCYRVCRCPGFSSMSSPASTSLWRNRKEGGKAGKSHTLTLQLQGGIPRSPGFSFSQCPEQCSRTNLTTKEARGHAKAAHQLWKGDSSGHLADQPHPHTTMDCVPPKLEIARSTIYSSK